MSEAPIAARFYARASTLSYCRKRAESAIPAGDGNDLTLTVVQ